MFKMKKFTVFLFFSLFVTIIVVLCITNNQQLTINNQQEFVDTVEIRKKAKLLTFIDDDGHTSFVDKLLPIIKEKNISISMAIETSRAGTRNFMDWETIRECHEQGAEVLNHSKYHIYSKAESEKRSKDDIRNEMIESIEDLSSNGYEETSDIWVYPGASAGATVTICSKVMRCGINSSGSVVNDYEFIKMHKYGLKRFPICNHMTNTLEDLKGYINQLNETPGWEIWMMHSIYNEMSEDFLNDFRKAIDYCLENNIRIVSVKEALDFYGVINENKN